MTSAQPSGRPFIPPFDHPAPHVKPAPKAAEHHVLAGLELAALPGLVQGDRNRGRRRVAVAVDAVDHLVACRVRAARRPPRGCACWPGGRRTGRSRRARARRGRPPRRVASDRRWTAARKVSWPCMWMTWSSWLAQIDEPPLPSARSTICPIRPGPPLAGPTTAAPAPSANSAAVPRSALSVKRLSTSAPITSTWSQRPHSIWAAASERADRKPVQAAPTSIAPASWRPAPAPRAARRWAAARRPPWSRPAPGPSPRGQPGLLERLPAGGGGEVRQALALGDVPALVHAGAGDDPAARSRRRPRRPWRS